MSIFAALNYKCSEIMEQIREQDLMPCIGEFCPFLEEEDAGPEVIKTVDVGFIPAIIHAGRVVKTHEFTDEERKAISQYPTEAFLDGRFVGILEAVGQHHHAG